MFKKSTSNEIIDNVLRVGVLHSQIKIFNFHIYFIHCLQSVGLL